MRLYDYGPSQNCFKVRLLAAHLGLQLERVPVALFRGEGQSPEFLAKNPMGSVPVLETGPGHYLPESNAILTFLAEGTPYLPESGTARADVMRWLFFEQVYVQTSIALLRYWTLTGKLERYAAAVPPRRALGERVLRALESALTARPFIAGEAYAIADISLYAYSHLAAEAGFDLGGLPALRAWCSRVREQAGFAGQVIPYSSDPASASRLPLAG